MVTTHVGIVQTSIEQAVHLFVYMRGGLELAVFLFPFIGKLVSESGTLILDRQIKIGVDGQIRLPRHIVDAEVKSLTVIVGRHPRGESAIIGASAPFARLVVQPKGTLRCMARTPHGHFAGGGNGIYFGHAL